MKITKELHSSIIAGDILLRMIFGAKRFDAYREKCKDGTTDLFI